MTGDADVIGRHWQRIGMDLGFDAEGDADVDAVWSSILGDALERHREPHRHYHAVSHVAAVLRALAQLAGSPGASLVLAAVFHDVIYDPTAATNERDSAVLAKDRLRDAGVGEALIGEVCGLILATEAHDASAAVGVDRETAAVFLDADLSILGAPSEDYDRYARDIRLEYGHVPDDDFRTGRSAILTTFLERDRLFLTDDAHRAWDAAARANLRRELDGLTG